MPGSYIGPFIKYLLHNSYCQALVGSLLNSVYLEVEGPQGIIYSFCLVLYTRKLWLCRGNALTKILYLGYNIATSETWTLEELISLKYSSSHIFYLNLIKRCVQTENFSSHLPLEFNHQDFE